MKHYTHYQHFGGSEEAALAFVLARLAENPNTPRAFFVRNWGISDSVLDRWIAEGKITAFIPQPKMKMRKFK